MQVSSSHHHSSPSKDPNNNNNNNTTTTKRFRSGSISSRLRSASELFDEGIIETRQKGILKDLIISEDARLIEAFNQYERGDKSAVERLIQSFNLDFRKSSLDLLGDVGDLSMDFLSVGGGTNHHHNNTSNNNIHHHSHNNNNNSQQPQQQHGSSSTNNSGNTSNNNTHGHHHYHHNNNTNHSNSNNGNHNNSNNNGPLFPMDDDSIEFFEHTTSDVIGKTPPLHPTSLMAMAAATTSSRKDIHHHHHHTSSNNNTQHTKSSSHTNSNNKSSSTTIPITARNSSNSINLGINSKELKEFSLSGGLSFHNNNNHNSSFSGHFFGSSNNNNNNSTTTATTTATSSTMTGGRKREPSILLDIGTPLGPGSTLFGAHPGPKMSFSGEADFFELLPGSRNPPVTPRDDFSSPTDQTLRGGMFGPLRTLLDATTSFGEDGEDDLNSGVEDSIIFKLGNHHHHNKKKIPATTTTTPPITNSSSSGTSSPFSNEVLTKPIKNLMGSAAANAAGSVKSSVKSEKSKPLSKSKNAPNHHRASSSSSSAVAAGAGGNMSPTMSSENKLSLERSLSNSTTPTKSEKNSWSTTNRNRSSPVPAITSTAILANIGTIESIEERTAAKRKQGINMVGAYSPDSRRLRVQRFVDKRDRRVWKKKVKYDVRKNFADSRLRVKGRFVKKEDEEMLRDLISLT
jgi:hypothetical protein